MAVAAEGVGEDDVGSGIHVGLVDGPDPVRMVQVPELGWVAGGEAGGEQLRAHGAVDDEETIGFEEFRQTDHGRNLSPHIRQVLPGS